MNLRPLLTPVYPVPDRSLDKLTGIMKQVSLPKGHLLFRAGKVENSLYFIEKGIARAYCYYKANEVTFWFGSEGDTTVLSMRSYVENKPSYENIELLENSDLLQIKVADLQQLYTEDVHLANWGRKLAEQELVKTEERLIARQFKTALERYQELIQNKADLLQRVQLGHIASYLGHYSGHLKPYQVRNEIAFTFYHL